MKKAVVFPINYDNREIIQYSSLIEDYTIVLGIVLEKFSDDTFPDDKVLRYSDLEIESIEFDTIIFLSRVEDYSPDLYSSLIRGYVCRQFRRTGYDSSGYSACHC